MNKILKQIITIMEIEKLLKVLEGFGSNEQPLTIGLFKLILKEYEGLDKRLELKRQFDCNRQL